jgi:diguanylate cyclase (GGDEF)-like protein/PAS domain S-box-containing protein
MVATHSIKPGHSSATRGVVIIVALFVSIVLLLACIIYIEGKVFDGVRSYVRGEGLWAKAQKDAVLYLERYSYSHADADYVAFQRSIGVITGDSNARVALLEAPPDVSKARQGFLQGKNDVQDVDSLIWFFLNFQRISYMHDAIGIWEEGDARFEDLVAVGDELKREIDSGRVHPKKIEGIREQLKGLNVELLDLENRFSQVLGEGARWVKATVWELSLALLVVVVGMGIVVSRKIIGEIARSERELLVSESRFSSLRESGTIGIASWNMDGRVTEANDMLLGMLGFSRADLFEGRLNWRDLTPGEFRERDQQAIRELETYGRCEPYEKSFFHKQGSLVPVYLGASMLQGDKEQGIAFVIDMTERKKAEEALQLAGLVYQSISEAIIVTDADNHIIATNPAFTELTGYTFEEVCGRNPSLLSSGRHDREFYEAMWRAINDSGAWQGEIWNCRKNGEIYVEWLTINTIYNADGSVHRWVALFSDISEQKKAEEIIKQQANYDILTGLPNRRMVHDRLEQQIKKSRREGLPSALLFIDLDRFKEVNDTLGHEMGDVLLKESAQRMLNCVRESDTVGRLGGDEFTIILGELDDVESVERIVSDVLVRLSSPFKLGDVLVHVSASIGIALYPDDAEDAATLLRNADQAMYAAKRDGRNGSHYYSRMNADEVRF